MKTFLPFTLVFLGGGLGATLRYLISLFYGPTSSFATLVPNVLGCFIMGLVLAYLTQGFAYLESYRAFLIMGFLGSLTTFSSYIVYIEMSGFFTAKTLIYIFLSHVLGVGALLLGMFSIKLLH